MLGKIALPTSGYHKILINNGKSCNLTIAIARIRYLTVLFLSFVTVAFADRHCHRPDLFCDIDNSMYSCFYEAGFMCSA